MIRSLDNFNLLVGLAFYWCLDSYVQNYFGETSDECRRVLNHFEARGQKKRLGKFL